MIITDMLLTRTVLDAELALYVAHTPMALATVVFHVTVRSASVIGIAVEVNAVSDVPFSTSPWPTTAPDVPSVVMMPRHSSRHGHDAAVAPTVTAPDSARTVVIGGTPAVPMPWPRK